jgi:hypothetical protein
VLSYTPIPGTPMAKKAIEMNREKNIQKFSFHFSGGVKNNNYGPHFIHLALLWCYLYFGTKQIWLSFKSSPRTFLKIVPSRIFMGLVWGNPLLLTSLYSLIHADYWVGWRKSQAIYWDKNFKMLYDSQDQQQETINVSERLNEKFLPSHNYDDIVLSKNAIK